MGKKRKKNLNKYLLIPVFILTAIIASLLFSFFKISPSYSPADYVCEGDPNYPDGELEKSTTELCLDEGFTTKYSDTDEGIKWQTRYADGWHVESKERPGICPESGTEKDNGYFYVDTDDATAAGHDGPIIVTVPTIKTSNVYKINIWYSIEEKRTATSSKYSNKENFRIICIGEDGKEKEYKFLDKDLINNPIESNVYHNLKEGSNQQVFDIINPLCYFGPDKTDPISQINTFKIDSLSEDIKSQEQHSVHFEKFQLIHCILKESPLPPPPPPGIPPVVGEAKFAQLPFFTPFNLITTTIVIALIYTIIHLAKSFNHRQNL